MLKVIASRVRPTFLRLESSGPGNAGVSVSGCDGRCAWARGISTAAVAGSGSKAPECPRREPI